MGEIKSSAIHDQEVPANQTCDTRTMLEAIVPRHRAIWSKLSPSEEIADLLQCGGAVLQGETAQAGNDVVEGDEFAGAVRPLDPEEEFSRLRIVMDADVERALSGDPNLLCGMVAAGGEGQASTHAATTSRSMVKLSGRSVVWLVPLGTPISPRFLSLVNVPFPSFHFVEFILRAGYTGRRRGRVLR